MKQGKGVVGALPALLLELGELPVPVQLQRLDRLLMIAVYIGTIEEVDLIQHRRKALMSLGAYAVGGFAGAGYQMVKGSRPKN